MTPQSTKTKWQYLEQRPNSWRKQLYLKGRRLTAFGLWMDMIVNELSVEAASDNWDLPIAAIHEVIEYCQTNQELLKQEAQEERRYLEERGIPLEPQTID